MHGVVACLQGQFGVVGSYPLLFFLHYFFKLILKMLGKDEGADKEKCLECFLKIGLDERTAKNSIVNKKVTANLTAVIDKAGIANGCDRSVGNLLYTVATKYPSNALLHRPTLLGYIVSSKIKTTAQLDAASSFLADTGLENVDLKKFEESCGVGHGGCVRFRLMKGRA